MPGAGRRDGLTHARLTDVLDAGDEVTDFAGAETPHRGRVRRAHTDLLRVVGGVRLHETQLGATVERAIEDAYRADDAAIRVVVRVEQQRLQRCVWVARRRRDVLDDCVEQLGYALSGLRRDPEHLARVDSEHTLDLPRDAVGVGRGKVDLVHRRDDREVVLERQVAVGEGLRLDALRRVDEQQRAFAGSKAARDLVSEVDVPRRVDEAENVVLPFEAHVLGLDGDAALALEVHRVEVLGPHVAGVDRAGELQDAVGQGGLAVVDMSDDREGTKAFERAHPPILAVARGTDEPVRLLP